MGVRARFVLLVLAACTFAACAASQATESGGEDDASADGVDASRGDDANLPPADALVLAEGDTPDAAGDAIDETPPQDDAGPTPGSCKGLSDGTVCVKAPDACHTDATCKGGLCGGLGTRPDGYNWKSGDDNARCCLGKAIEVSTDTDCGACGIKCNAGNGESCQLLGGRYFCRGCIASASCWSKCCSTSFSPYSCAASDCAGNCSSTYCPTGTHCVPGAPNSSDYCSY